ncbi:ParA family protein [Simiduia sp. 21SJ11W-1]|uniref:ParA family protein n=1 Tax=Simiduia sp. 21SJ11W-1 TaxID=2909669 RepID=UPI00209F9E56|nr:ParA family protein [Simiduia sp. 21SJ11W-1]UTA49510.1 ParA family protein [Simiduia sp. 21SJ11W-1]
MEIWSVANQKGGVGKTTTAVSLAGLLGEQGKRVLLVDLDPHGSLSSYFGYDPDQQEQGTYALFQQKDTLAAAAVQALQVSTSMDNVALLPASTALATLERQAIGRDGMGLVVGKALKLIQQTVDVAIIDSPPLLGILLVNALAACDKLVIPVQTEFLALKGLERMTHTLAMMSRSRNKSVGFSIIPTMYDRRTQASVASLRHLRNHYGDDVFPGRIPVDTKFRDASKAGLFPHQFSNDSHGVDAYRQCVKWLQGLNAGSLEQVS